MRSCGPSPNSASSCGILTTIKDIDNNKDIDNDKDVDNNKDIDNNQDIDNNKDVKWNNMRGFKRPKIHLL
jgi:hypothetical protein